MKTRREAIGDLKFHAPFFFRAHKDDFDKLSDLTLSRLAERAEEDVHSVSKIYWLERMADEYQPGVFATKERA